MRSCKRQLQQHPEANVRKALLHAVARHDSATMSQDEMFDDVSEVDAGRDVDALEKDKEEHCRDAHCQHTHLQQTVIDSVAEDSATSTTSTYDCPVCRKAQLLDLDRLQVGQP